MLTVITALIGFISSAVPDLIRIFQDSRDKKHEITLLKMQLEKAQLLHEQKLEEINTTADISEVNSLHQNFYSPAQILSANQKLTLHWVDVLNSTVRPVIAYSFFALYASVKFAYYQHTQDIISIWNEHDMAIFAGIISFYYGQRAMQKRFGK